VKPVLQLALDFINLEQALRAAREAVAGGVDWVEAGTPLIKSEGLDAVRALRREFPSATVVADMKVMDAGRTETECAAKAGADVVHVLGAASDATIRECVEAAERYRARICVDLIGIPTPEAMIARARAVRELGAAHVCIHTPIDMQMRGEVPFAFLRTVAAEVDMPVAVAGGINSESVVRAIEAGAAIVIVGGAITKAPDATAAARAIREAMESGTPVETTLFKRVGADGIAEVLMKASAADVTGALHNTGDLRGIHAIVPGAKLVGRALTVWTYPGDWSKPVQAIDQAEDGAVIVVDAGDQPPAIWGEMATHSCLQRHVTGVVISGGIRDVAEIRRMSFPAFASHICPAAGEPKGQGMIGVPIRIGGRTVRSGDWLVGDDDGVVVIPAEKAVEIANRALAVVEQEERQIAEIDGGSTLGKVSELTRWEQLRRDPDGREE